MDDVEADKSRKRKGDDDGERSTLIAETCAVDVLDVCCFLVGAMMTPELCLIDEMLGQRKNPRIALALIRGFLNSLS